MSPRTSGYLRSVKKAGTFQRPAIVASGAPHTAEPSMGMRILVVEDEPAIADTISYALTTDGFQPVWSATGEAALAEVAGGGIALIILDVGLPDINGFELFKRLTQVSSAPVIFLTARSHEVDRVVGLELGADDYISKPFSPRELTARVRSVLRRVARAAARQRAEPYDLALPRRNSAYNTVRRGVRL